MKKRTPNNWFFRLTGWTLLLILPQFSFSQVNATARLDSTRIMIGDQIGLHLQVSSSDPLQLQPPLFPGMDTITELEILTTGDWDTLNQNGRTIYQKDFTITAWDSGFFWIPRILIPYRTASTQAAVRTPDPLPLTVATVPIDTSALAPIKPIITTPGAGLQWQFLAIMVGVILLFIGLIMAWRKWVRAAGPPIPEAEEIQRPAHEVALQKIDLLETQQLLQKGEEKEYQSQLTYILREYIEGRFNIHALEQTTDQILRQLTLLDLSADQVTVLKELLPVADLVKFAKATPPESFHVQALANVRQWVTETIPVPEPEIKEEEE